MCVCVGGGVVGVCMGEGAREADNTWRGSLEITPKPLIYTNSTDPDMEDSPLLSCMVKLSGADITIDLSTATGPTRHCNSNPQVVPVQNNLGSEQSGYVSIQTHA